ncbi:DUF3426 domain-containing protein [Achromobacter sp. UMC71]|uniref:DUF3426 domain-containing protein n=1 Tax=Achromobacter sp. UMC71 TaxID=1862320 RepID=UPI001601DE53|nr:DUF3426 domain-containing protein [Achromobacter sp. UMC71]MBB1628780.1 hypothetical protein [Achromobacter sp. UMC71]
MALTTRCPQCGTSFKVVPDQLRVRNGLVRCGACATVFDGRACLLPEAGAAPAAVPVPPQTASPVAPQAPAASAIAAPVLATPVAPPPPQPRSEDTPPLVQRPSAEPARTVAPWDDLPVPAPPRPEPVMTPAAAAPVVVPVTPPAPPAVPPAVLRGRDDIRRRIEPDAALAEAGDDDEDENEDLDRYNEADEPPAAPRWQQPPAPSYRDEPIVARRDAATAARWDAPRNGAPAEPVFVVRDEPADRRRDDDDAVDQDQDWDEHPDEHPDEYRDRNEDPDHEQDAGREPILGEARTRYSSATDVGRAPPDFLDQDRQARRGLMRKLWGYACLLGLIALGLQLLYVYRIDIANSVPVLRPALEAACKPLGCAVGYARRLERIAISSSSLQPPTGAAAIDDGRTRLVLNLVLRNRYDKPQHWPALVLDLTDLSDTVVVRRVLMPENYLTPEQLRGPFGPAGELKISVPIEVTGVQVNGYQLDKFFP